MDQIGRAPVARLRRKAVRWPVSTTAIQPSYNNAFTLRAFGACPSGHRLL